MEGKALKHLELGESINLIASSLTLPQTELHPSALMYFKCWCFRVPVSLLRSTYDRVTEQHMSILIIPNGKKKANRNLSVFHYIGLRMLVCETSFIKLWLGSFSLFKTSVPASVCHVSSHPLRGLLPSCYSKMRNRLEIPPTGLSVLLMPSAWHIVLKTVMWFY